jgi:uncharacterized protein (DUF362 family)
MTTRREFLRRSSVATCALLLPPVGVGCAAVPTVDPGEPATDGVLISLQDPAQLTSAEDGVTAALERMDFSWLGAGDSVFLKLASNSRQRHPAVTSPAAVSALCRGLRERGAGRVLVGDQAGVMSVRLAAGDRRFSSTRDVFESNGLLAAVEDGGGEAHFFDDGSYEDDYVEATFGFESKWVRPPRIPRVVTEVDHIVYVPRLASHMLTGCTLGHKISVGWMRDDTRHDMHAEAGDIYEKYTDLNYCDEIQSRLRLVITHATEVLVDGGPDQGTVATASPHIVIASPHLANHDAVATQVLMWARENLEVARRTGGGPHGPWAPVANTALLAAVEARTGIPWTHEGGLPSTYGAHDFAAGVPEDRVLTRAYELLGGVPNAIHVDMDGDAPSSLRTALVDKARAALTG